MTSHHSCYRNVPEMDPMGTQPVPVTGVVDGGSRGTDGELNLELARRYDDGYEEGASTAAAALFAGVFIGAGSTALMVWLAALIF